MPERLMERSISASCTEPTKDAAIAAMREQLVDDAWTAEAISRAIESLATEYIDADAQDYRVRKPFTGYHVRALVKIGVDGERSAVTISADYVKV